MVERVKEYIAAVAREWKSGVATEHSYRPPLKALLDSLLPGMDVINEPAHIDCGAPDLLVRSRDAARRPVGYVETKAPGDGDLDGNGPNKAQFDRYRQHLHNVVFTDYLDFRFWEDGQFKAACRIASIEGGRIVAENGDALDRFAALVQHFGSLAPRKITSPARLASLMAAKARLLASAIRAALATGASGETPLPPAPLHAQFEVFRKFLIHDLTPDDFADIYAQTVAYAFFAARLHDPTPEDFSREEAVRLIPKTNPLLRKMFRDIEGDLDDSIAWIFDDLVSLFAAANVAEIMRSYRSGDPILHFYEDFLAEYDPALRKQRGVWYTPASVVKFIVGAVDDILIRDFSLPGGLADSTRLPGRETHRVQILDPATGTGTFLAEAVRKIHSKFAAMQGAWPDYAAQHLLPRINGFEILMASYAMAHLKLDMVLQETFEKQTDLLAANAARDVSGVSREQIRLSNNQRFRIFLTNSLEEHAPETGTLWAAALSQEAQEANYIKRDCPVMVVMGNPPYSGESQNKGEWIMRLMEDYKTEPGGKEKLRERNPKWLNDDYVKFLRLAQFYVERNGEGVVAYINPHGFLDNPTFRGMRWRLASAFDEIYILNLHGNTKKKETAPDGSKDENVFDIQQGVSINIFVKKAQGGARLSRPQNDGGRDKRVPPSLATVHYADLYGLREAKYAALDAATLDSIAWQPIPLKPPYYFFVPKDFSLEEEYNKGFAINELFPVNSMGVTTGDDATLIGDDAQSLLAKVAQKHGNADAAKVRPVAYRPFDAKLLYYDARLLARAREKFVALAADGLALCCIRINSRGDDLPIFVTDKITDKTLLSSKDNANVFPLYLYRSGLGGEEKVANLDKAIAGRILGSAGVPPAGGSGAEPPSLVAGETPALQIFHYIYAILHSPAYRARYREFLKVDFPRIPYPASAEEFWHLASIGERLVAVHLLKDPSVRDMFSPVAAFPLSGTNRVDAVRRDGSRVYINDTQYFDNVPDGAWDYWIGGYQPAQKWLKDHKGRVLSFDDIGHYKSIILALDATARLVAEIDTGEGGAK